MATEILHNKNLKIQTYSLPDMLQEVQQGILDGYRLDYEQNETYPFGSGSFYEVTLVPVKPKKEEKTEARTASVAEKPQATASIATPETEAEKEVKTVAQTAEPSKRGRKSEGK